MKQLFTNNAVSLLAVGIGPIDTELRVLPGHGDLFPTPQPDEFFTVTLEDEAATMQEIIHVVSRDGDSFSIKRGQEGTQPRAWAASQGSDTVVDHRITASTLYSLSNTFANPQFPQLKDFGQALNYLLEGRPVSGEQVTDAEISVDVDGEQTVITTQSAYKQNTVSVHVGGLRQKRNIDFVEISPTEIRLLYIEESQNIVVDYVLI